MAEARAESLYTKFGKIIPTQLPADEDLISSIKKVCNDHGIRYATILSAVGTLHSLTIESVIYTDKTKTGLGASPHQLVAGPLQLLSLVGVIYETSEGKMETHVHGTFSVLEDTENKIYGGHLIEGKCPIATRMFVVIGEFADVSLIERSDQKSGHRVVHIEPR